MGRHHHEHGRKRIASHSLPRRRSDAHVRRAEPWLRLRRTKQAGAMDGPDCVNPALTGMGRHHHEHGRKRIASHSNRERIRLWFSTGFGGGKSRRCAVLQILAVAAAATRSSSVRRPPRLPLSMGPGKLPVSRPCSDAILAGCGIAAIARIACRGRRVGRREDGERGGPPPARQLMPPARRRGLETVASVAAILRPLTTRPCRGRRAPWPSCFAPRP